MKTIISLILFIVSSATALSLHKIGLSDGTDFIGIKTGEDSSFLYFEELNMTKHSFPLNDVEYISELNLVEVTMTSGTVVVGYIEEITDTKVKIGYPGYGESEYYRTNIESVKPEKEYGSEINPRTNPENKSYLYDYHVFGVTLGMPGGTNLLFGNYGPYMMINGTIGVLGASISTGAVLSHGEHLNSALCADLSYIYFLGFNTIIFGPSFQVNIHGFFVEIGLGFVLDMYSNMIVPDIQIGYVFRLND